MLGLIKAISIALQQLRRFAQLAHAILVPLTALQALPDFQYLPRLIDNALREVLLEALLGSSCSVMVRVRFGRLVLGGDGLLLVIVPPTNGFASAVDLLTSTFCLCVHRYHRGICAAKFAVHAAHSPALHL